MHRAVRAVVDLDAFRRNWLRACAFAGTRQVWPVIKGDAYGHGMVELAEALPGASGFCVADLDEGLTLRRSGIDQPILVIQGPADEAGLRAAVAANLVLGIHDPVQVELLRALLPQFGADRVALWLKLETGMHRLGLDPAQVPALHDEFTALGAVRELGLMTHLACADEPEHPLNAAQCRAFADAAEGHASGPLSVCNSAALIAGIHEQDTIVRPGYMLYGGSPLLDRSAEAIGLEPVMTLRSRLIAVKTVAAGETVGYAASWRATGPTRIGLVAAGYGDGYPRHAPSGTPVRIGNVDVVTVGRVSMDSITVDLTAAPDARVGDEVTLWGRGLGVDRIAAAAGTIGLELLTRVPPRVPRLYEDLAISDARAEGRRD